jgi:hypothetical protein
MKPNYRGFSRFAPNPNLPNAGSLRASGDRAGSCRSSRTIVERDRPSGKLRTKTVGSVNDRPLFVAIAGSDLIQRGVARE